MIAHLTRGAAHDQRRVAQARAATTRPAGDRRSRKGSRSQQRSRAVATW